MKFLTKLLITFGLFVVGLTSFSEASQFFAYNKQMSKNTDIPNFTILGTRFFTDIVDIDKVGFTGSVRFIVQSTYNCSPGTIYVKDNSLNGSSYLRYSMSYISDVAMCVSPEIDLSGLSSLKFFYGTTQNTNNSAYVQFVIVDSDSFDLSVKPLSTGFSASVSIPTTCPDCPSCPTINSEYCINNNLCPSCPTINKSFCKSEYGLLEPSECPISGGGTGEVSWSALFINNIQHLGSPVIRINIPSEIDWDYTRNDDNFDLDIVGLNGDEEYIEGIISVQNYTPTSEDFTQVFQNLVPYIKILIFVLFLFVVWKWIRKMF